MKQILSVLLLFFLLIVTVKVNAQNAFDRYDSNPLNVNFDKTRYLEFYQTDIKRNNNAFNGLFSTLNINGKYIITNGSSEDGVNWNINKEVHTENLNIFAPRKTDFLIDGKYKLLYTLETPRLSIYSLDCDLLNNCDATPKLEILPDAGLWDVDAAASAFPYYDGSKYMIFYEGLSSGVWRIGMATSPDFKNWTKCQKTIVDYAGGAFLHKEDSKYSLYFHNSGATGIEVVELNGVISCDSIWQNRHFVLPKSQPYESQHMTAPSIVNNDGNIWLYYTGKGSDGVRTLDLAINKLQSITSTPSPTPTSVPTAVPTVPAGSRRPMVLIPGMFGSWNKEAVLHNTKTPQTDWALAPFVHEYDGLIATFKNLGYTQGVDFFVFPYDWRQEINTSAQELGTFIATRILNNYPPGTKVDIVGHSLGGVVGALYTNSHSNFVNQLITAGSPHQGTAKVYKLVEAGEIERENDLIWLASKFILTLNKAPLESDKTTLEKVFPVARDLMPTYDFLKKGDKYIANSALVYNNPSLPAYNTPPISIAGLTTTLYGKEERMDTLLGYKIVPQTSAEKKLGIYPDGRPTAEIKSYGDELIPVQSARIEGAASKKIDADHWELVSSKVGIKNILEALHLPYTPNQITPGRRTQVDGSLLLYLRSPATLTLTDSTGHTWHETDGIIYVEDIARGRYTITLTGTGDGEYTLGVGQIGKNHDEWNKYKGIIAPNQKVSYTIYINSTNPHDPMKHEAEDDERDESGRTDR